MCTYWKRNRKHLQNSSRESSFHNDKKFELLRYMSTQCQQKNYMMYFIQYFQSSNLEYTYSVTIFKDYKTYQKIKGKHVIQHETTKILYREVFFDPNH